MFSKAYSEAIAYTRPIILLVRTEDDRVNAGIGSYIVLNRDGWILTAAHILGVAIRIQNDADQRRKFREAVDNIESNQSISHKVKRRMVRELPRNDKWIKNYSFVFAGGPAQITGQAFIDGTADIAVAQLSTLEGLNISGFPRFPKLGEGITPGTSLCTLGFPFQGLSATFDEQSNRFNLGQIPLLAFFPSEGMHTRGVMIVEQPANRTVPFVETSSPGLKGQSGGPIFDVNGIVRAIQSRTAAYSLDIAPVVKEDGKETKEHQFIQVGMGCHAEHIAQFLTQNGIAFDRAE
jgi:hypothetical protein